MSTIKITNIQATGETATRAVSGVAAAWGTKNSAGTSILDSFNISSLSDNGTGAAQWSSIWFLLLQATAVQVTAIQVIATSFFP